MSGRGSKVLRSLSLGFVLMLLWVLMSGLTEPLSLALGAASAVVVVLLCRRMDVIDHEGHPIHLGWRSVFYWPWLVWEILKSNVQVARVILGRPMAIQPAVFKVRGSQKSELGHVIYGNSITLTPGTVTIGLERGQLTIHALTTEAADGVKSGAMDRRVTAMMGAEIQNGKASSAGGGRP